MNEVIDNNSAVKVKTYTKSERNWYLVGLAGQNIMYNIVNACIMYFLQFTVLIPAMTVSIIFTVARIFDACNDPIMGTIVDRTRSKYGKCVPYLRIIPIPIMIISILCYVSFGFYGDGSKGLDIAITAWTAFTYITWGMLYTVGDIPLWGVTSLMTEDAKDREKLLTLARVVAAIAGGVIMLSMQSVSLGLGGALSTKFGLSAPQGEKYGFLIVAIILSIIGTAMFQVTGFKVKERIAPTQKTNLKENIGIIFHNKPYMQLMLSGILGSTKSIINIVAMTLVSYYFASKDPIMAFVYLLLLGGGVFIGMFVGMAIVPVLNKKLSKKHIYNWSNLISVIPYMLIFVAYKISPHHLTDIVWVILCFFLFGIVGLGQGATTVLQSTMIADCVDYEEYKNNRRPDGLFFSGQTFLVKLQNGLATIICGIAYTIVKFSDSRVAEVNAFITAGGTPRLSMEYSTFMMILFLIISIPPAIGSILTVIPTWKYALDDKEHNRIMEILIERRRQNAVETAEGTEAVSETNVDSEENANVSETVEGAEEQTSSEQVESDVVSVEKEEIITSDDNLQ